MTIEAAYKAGLWLVSGNLDFRRVPVPPSPWSSSLGLVCANSTLYAELLLSSWDPWILLHVRQGYPWGKILNSVSNELPQLATFHICHHSSLLGGLISCCVPPPGEDCGSLCLIYPRFLLVCLSLCWFCFVSFWVQHNYMQILWQILGNHWTREGLGDLLIPGPGYGNRGEFCLWMKLKAPLIRQTRSWVTELTLYFWLEVNRSVMRSIKFSCRDRTTSPIS